MDLENMLSATVGNFKIAMEADPDPKSSTNFLKIKKEYRILRTNWQTLSATSTQPPRN